MNEEMIGTLAGKIWAVLSEQPRSRNLCSYRLVVKRRKNDRYPKGKRFRLLLELKIPIRKKMY